jgi:hypothetical protein
MTGSNWFETGLLVPLISCYELEPNMYYGLGYMICQTLTTRLEV